MIEQRTAVLENRVEEAAGRPRRRGDGRQLDRRQAKIRIDERSRHDPGRRRAAAGGVDDRPQEPQRPGCVPDPAKADLDVVRPAGRGARGEPRSLARVGSIAESRAHGHGAAGGITQGDDGPKDRE